MRIRMWIRMRIRMLVWMRVRLLLYPPWGSASFRHPKDADTATRAPVYSLPLPLPLPLALHCPDTITVTLLVRVPTTAPPRARRLERG